MRDDDMTDYILYCPEIDKIEISREYRFNEYMGHWIIVGEL